MIRFSCGQCGRVHEVDDQLAGKTVRCQCRETLRVPVPPAPASPPAAAGPARAPKRPGEPREPWFYRFIESYAEAALALGGIACLLDWLLGAAVFVQLGVNVFLGVVLSLLTSGLAFMWAVFWTALVLVVLDAARQLRKLAGRKED